MAEKTVYSSIIDFIKTIEKHECLWNNRIPELNKRSQIKATWKIISHEFQEPIPVLRERWRNIRNTFIRSMKKSAKDNPPGSKSKGYYLAKYLQFLLPHIRHHFDFDYNILYPEDQTEIAAISSDDEDYENESANNETSNNKISFTIEDPGELSPTTNYQEPEITTDEINQQQSQQIHYKTKLQSQIKFQKKIQLQHHTQNLDPLQDDYVAATKRKRVDCENSHSIPFVKNRELEQEEANFCFLKSLLPDFNSMNKIQNRRFRKKVISLMEDILNDSDIILNDSDQNHHNNHLLATSSSQPSLNTTNQRDTSDRYKNSTNNIVTRQRRYTK
ncbi:uncharacterized protein LOC129605158 [Condylostylus longicornis]|uniref:uncharacterized protein LOC129605158 n=1 Tax=Condylostylus longicornis TaxID=2530218 RepID=UPI00244E403D|nr:uncharacterized protein LOC129605158 [Condylostylus longicornis]